MARDTRCGTAHTLTVMGGHSRPREIMKGKCTGIPICGKCTVSLFWERGGRGGRSRRGEYPICSQPVSCRGDRCLSARTIKTGSRMGRTIDTDAGCHACNEALAQRKHLPQAPLLLRPCHNARFVGEFYSSGTCAESFYKRHAGLSPALKADSTLR